MESLLDLISSDIRPERARSSLPAADRVDAPIVATGNETVPRAFELTVFNFLLAHKAPLGISDVWRCRNVRVDGLLDLVDGRRVALEIKYAMNWEKACQACAQFAWYRARIEPNEKSLAGGLVVFQTFTGDWARRKKKWLLESGWSFFYADHPVIEGLRVDLVRLRDGALESLPSALAAAEAEVSAQAKRAAE